MYIKFRQLVLAVAVLAVAAPLALGQQTYVTRYDLFTGYTFLDSPTLGMSNNGFQMQFGYRPTTWYSLGFDYSYSRGNMSLTPNLLTNQLQSELLPTLEAGIAGAIKAGLVPSTYTLVVPATDAAQTFAVGPQLAYRHFQKFTLFLRPSMGAIHDVATAGTKAGDPFVPVVVQGLEGMGLLTTAGKATDWQGFYGVGYGVDFLFSNHVGLRIQGDTVYTHPFNDLLQNGFWITRVSVGPCFNFGRNIAGGGD